MGMAQGDIAGEASPLSSGRVTEALRRDILSGRLAPGTRLRQEDLAEAYGTSRIPVREALRRLESEGLVSLVPNSGAWVSRLDRTECIEIYRIRERLEPLAIEDSCANLPAGTIDELDSLQRRIEAAKDIEEFLMLDRQFHLLSYAGTRMPRLRAIITNYWNSTQQYRRAFARETGIANMGAVHQEHALLVDALRRRDREYAATILLVHIRRARMKLETSVASASATMPSGAPESPATRP